ncbi:MAG: calcium-binding protein [Tepidisphaeraceae bacterium]
MIETLEGRRLLAGQPFGNFINGALVITGTSGDDLLSFRTSGPRTIARLNGVPAKFTTANFNRIEVNTGDGVDIVDFAAMTLPCYVNLGAGNDIAYGGAGNDSLTGAAGRDTLIGNAGNDRLSGGNTGDSIVGGEGDDVLYGGFGTDVLDGGSGRDRLFGEEDNDILIGGTQTDGIYAGDGDDSLYGQAGNDILSGEAGNDTIVGADGNDIITGGDGVDYMYGQDGDDTIDAEDDTADALIDAGAGTDTVTLDTGLETALNAETINGSTDGGTGTVDPPVVPVGGDLAKAMSFGDEAYWDANFSDAVAKTKALGVKVVRVWFEVSSYDERPHAYDNVDTADIIKNWRKGTAHDDRAVTGGLALKRAFQLKQAGFQVILTVSINGGEPPTSDQQVKDFYTFLMNSTETTNSTTKLKDAVDYWEVGQEVDLAANWKPSGTSKTTGLKQYVDDVLIPAASVLHTGATSNWEKVISASVSYSANDLSTILTEAKAQGQLNAIDYAGYHPYGRYIPDQSIDEIASRVSQAVKVSKQFGKPLAATEWNVRGYPIDGSRDTVWAGAIKSVYTNYIAPNFGIAVYYQLIDNLDGRGGGVNVSARPAGLFKHNSPISVTTTSSTDDLETYYNSPLVANSPFYDTLASIF